ncbi:RES family NAD+ phosphorylase [Roseivirga pacifica]|uniref:RES family NAD+ phosphorylase n=1 Tax=Roseivirga pacifica TaxID=1267423 RepID=UPI002095F1F5|nr:RES family NAD+ phosphorylase [Roseivirga pacifica]MCO6360968.1 hypothetical protein [Roseivirga pacifica]MCO6368857.1 hypothetical protein [Roseivirga pacifica]MCO6373001.1 hypothetical protein [Roseivirga pacifica]MCO6377061.1 hypothetical protein [Roseivirga pacifica]MCO6377662.1 hypothetical protein [Roseivirga pacifica]
MEDLQGTIKQLKKLDLQTTHINNIIALFMSVGGTENINLSLGVNSILLRARPNKGCLRFTDTQDLSIKPARYNTDFQRASTPRKTMFYSVYMSGQLGQKELDIMRTTAAYETIPEIRLPNNPYSEKLTLGYWTNHEPLNLMAIMHKKQYTEINPYTMEVFNAYREHLANCDKNLMQKSITFYDFLADEFSKKDIRGNYDYKISALFSEAASRNNIDGIIYPSVRLGGMSFNVALNELAMKKLKLDSVEEATVQQEGNNVSISVNAFTKCNNQSTFKLEDIPR